MLGQPVLALLEKVPHDEYAPTEVKADSKEVGDKGDDSPQPKEVLIENQVSQKSPAKVEIQPREGNQEDEGGLRVDVMKPVEVGPGGGVHDGREDKEEDHQAKDDAQGGHLHPKAFAQGDRSARNPRDVG